MDIEVNKFVKGHRYNTAISTLLASDTNEPNSIHEYLYRTARGLFFLVEKPENQETDPKVIPLNEEEAKQHFDRLTNKLKSKHEAFTMDEEQQGRPPIFDEPMKQTAIWLPKEMIKWLKSQPGTMSEVIRNLIKQAMNKQP